MDLLRFLTKKLHFYKSFKSMLSETWEEIMYTNIIRQKWMFTQTAITAIMPSWESNVFFIIPISKVNFVMPTEVRSTSNQRSSHTSFPLLITFGCRRECDTALYLVRPM